MSNFETKIKEKLKESTPDVLSNIKNDHRFKVPEKEEKASFLDIFKSPRIRVSLASLVIVFVLAMVIVAQPKPQVYASTVTIDINPQLELTLDEEDQVIDIVALNDDGTDIIDNIGKYKRVNIEIILERIVDLLDQNGYLEDTENFMMVYVDGENTEIKEHVQALVEAKIQQEIQKRNKVMKFVNRYDVDYTPLQLARIYELSEEYNIHPGRLMIMLEIRELDDSYTFRELRGMKIKELDNLYQSLKEPEDSESPGNGQGQGNN